MAVDVVAFGRPRATLIERLAALPAGVVLGVVVACSTVVRTIAALGHLTQVYFPDEYIYTALARGFAQTGEPSVRGHFAHFPSILEPLLASPFWLFHDPLLAYRLTQAENALLMSLGMVPVYLLARRLGFGKWTGIALGGAVAFAPTMFFSSFIFSGPVAYPLVAGAVYAAVCALDRPTPRAQLAFAGLTALATLARIQYLVLPVAFFVAALIVERGSVRRVISKLRVSFGVFGAALLVLVAAGPARTLGYYSGVTHEHVRPLGFVHWLGVDTLFFVYSVGIVVVPGAVVGLWFALRRPSSRTERAFAAFSVTLLGLVFCEAAVYASNGSSRFQERYLIAKLPLLVVAFALYVRRGMPGRRFVAGASAAISVFAVAIPLSGYTVGLDRQDSPFLMAVYGLEKVFGTASGSLVAALCITVLGACAFGVSVAGRRALAAGLALTALVCTAIAAGAYTVDHANAMEVRTNLLPADRSWIDHANLGKVALLETPGGLAARALEQLSWNGDVNDVYLLGSTAPIDPFTSTRTRFADDGRLLTPHGAVNSPLLVENYAVQVQLRDASLVGSAFGFGLWRPLGTPHADWATFGRFYDGWLAGSGAVVVWPDDTGRTQGTLRFSLTSPANSSPMRITFSGPGLLRSVFLRPGEHRAVQIPLDVRGLWQASFASSMHASLEDGRTVSVRIAGPTFVRSRAPQNLRST
jgi:hypothetical protein